jgi:peptidyl-prolyl cis-trans isomerase C
MKRFLALGVLAATVTTAACDGLGRAMTTHTDVVARAGGLELTVDEAAGLLAQNPRLPAESDVVDAVANLWVDYVLLAEAAQRDASLKSVDVGPLVDPILEQQVFQKLNETVINPDTTMSDEELKALYEKESPGAQVRARHILLRVAPDATPAQRDSVMAKAKELHDRAVKGADFAKLATENSEDPGSAKQGGDLGFFGRGQMVAPFDAAAFALNAGQISDVVETPFGYHIIKVEEKKLPSFAEVKEGFRQHAIQQKAMDATEKYVKDLTDSLQIKVQDGAYAVARDLAAKPMTRLSGRAANRALVSYKGGAFTASQYLAFVRARTSPSDRQRLSAAGDQELETVLTAIARNETLLQAAKKAGIETTPAERDSLSNEIRGQLAQALQATGLHEAAPQQGETQAQAVARRVNAFLGQIVRGEQQVLGLGPLSFSLRGERAGEVFERAYPKVVQKVQQSHQAATPDSPAMPQPAQTPGQ